ncbi:dirigent protein 22 [Brachypodium distachyon]|uniref:Dirigent protein n=1 Tax=Brachypodium distachyon TaxID=15368 RepID=A0A0Q3GXB5_BRADI|nr:dirigent protein 22 [Brachypodium distachyon]KQK15141.1 hypothetical protein BRADI_1g20941v3 [Brachypodium distachyon]|eukprot:XP_003559940.1 dirigent protein 22 [Brachypodium distachyon]
MLRFVLLLVMSSPALLVAGGGGDSNGLKHVRLFMHETIGGPNPTLVTSLKSPLGGNATFGSVGVLDNELRDGPDPKGSKLVGRFQGFFAGAGLVSPPGLLSAMNIRFTAGEWCGSSLALLGSVPSFGAPVERALVGGTGDFRLARGYSVMLDLGNPTPETALFQLDLFVLMYHAA